jgi:hypothetical protein
LIAVAPAPPSSSIKVIGPTNAHGHAQEAERRADAHWRYACSCGWHTTWRDPYKMQRAFAVDRAAALRHFDQILA